MLNSYRVTSPGAGGGGNSAREHILLQALRRRQGRVRDGRAAPRRGVPFKPIALHPAPGPPSHRRPGGAPAPGPHTQHPASPYPAHGQGNTCPQGVPFARPVPPQARGETVAPGPHSTPPLTLAGAGQSQGPPGSPSPWARREGRAPRPGLGKRPRWSREPQSPPREAPAPAPQPLPGTNPCFSRARFTARRKPAQDTPLGPRWPPSGASRQLAGAGWEWGEAHERAAARQLKGPRPHFGLSLQLPAAAPTLPSPPAPNQLCGLPASSSIPLPPSLSPSISPSPPPSPTPSL